MVMVGTILINMI